MKVYTRLQISTPFASGTERAVLDFYRKMQATAALPFCQHKTPEVVSKVNISKRGGRESNSAFLGGFDSGIGSHEEGNGER